MSLAGCADMKTTVLIGLLSVWLVGPAAAADVAAARPLSRPAAESPADPSQAHLSADRPLQAEAAESYAAREAAAPELEQWQGGHAGLYIGGSALTVVLIILLIVVIF